jgi:hypothetical protein
MDHKLILRLPATQDKSGKYGNQTSDHSPKLPADHEIKIPQFCMSNQLFFLLALLNKKCTCCDF